jgi:pimeloyl-ACP methyl ester carboxylesterase
MTVAVHPNVPRIGPHHSLEDLVMPQSRRVMPRVKSTNRVVLTVALALEAAMSSASAQTTKPTIVLVHGAFAESASWDGVVAELLAAGYPTVAVANPLRGLRTDASYVAAVLASINRPIVLVGHSYGGSVITNAVNGNRNVKALVYVAAFAPDAGESSNDLAGRFPGGTLGAALAPLVALPGGGNDMYIRQDKFRAQFAADVSSSAAMLMASTQRPVTEAALSERSGVPAWKTVPSWFIYGDRDLNIPPAAQSFMARRAGARETVVSKGASHAMMISQPHAVARLIERAGAVAAAEVAARR